MAAAPGFTTSAGGAKALLCGFAGAAHGTDGTHGHNPLLVLQQPLAATAMNTAIDRRRLTRSMNIAAFYQGPRLPSTERARSRQECTAASS